MRKEGLTVLVMIQAQAVGFVGRHDPYADCEQVKASVSRNDKRARHAGIAFSIEIDWCVLCAGCLGGSSICVPFVFRELSFNTTSPTLATLHLPQLLANGILTVQLHLELYFEIVATASIDRLGLQLTISASMARKQCVHL